MIVLGLIFILIRNQLPGLFTSEAMTSTLFSGGVIAWCINQIPDTLQITFCGVLKGLGKQEAASISSLIISFGVMLPLSYVFGNVMGCGLSGLFYGLLVGNIILSSFYCLLCVCTDWKKVSMRVVEEMKVSENNVNRE